MDLKDFIKMSLLEISEAVLEAKEEARIAIAPGTFSGKKQKDASSVDFEVSVVTSTEKGGSIKVWSVAEGNVSSENLSTSKIAFSVPVYFQGIKGTKRD